MKKIDDKYDVIIIGAGIGGLVCGCYLAKAGMKVLIVEKNDKVGGYCTSFKRKGFKFDISVLQNCGSDDKFGKIIDELQINKKINIARVDPSYVLINPQCQISINNDLNNTIANIQQIFKKEKRAIEKFFLFLNNSKFSELYVRRKDSLALYVEKEFRDKSLKVLIYFMFSQLGILPRKASILTAAMYFRNLIVKSGYYTEGGSQVFVDKICEKFKEFGGEIALSTQAIKIIIRKNKANGVILDNGSSIKSDFVVSACDATQTYLDLVDSEYTDRRFIKLIKRLKPSASAFIVNIGTRQSLRSSLPKCH